MEVLGSRESKTFFFLKEIWLWKAIFLYKKVFPYFNVVEKEPRYEKLCSQILHGMFNILWKVIPNKIEPFFFCLACLNGLHSFDVLNFWFSTTSWHFLFSRFPHEFPSICWVINFFPLFMTVITKVNFLKINVYCNRNDSNY